MAFASGGAGLLNALGWGFVAGSYQGRFKGSVMMDNGVPLIREGKGTVGDEGTPRRGY